MNKNIIFIVVALFLLAGAVADTELGEPCTTDAQCSFCTDIGLGECYCGPNTLGTDVCFLIEEPLEEDLPGTNETMLDNQTGLNQTEAAPAVNQTLIAELQQQIAVLQAQQANISSGITQQVGMVETSVASLEQQLNQQKTSLQGVQQQVAQLQQNIQAESNELNAVATGLAGLQANLTGTNEELNTVEEELAREQAFTRFVKYAFFTLLVVAVFLVGAYVITNKGKTGNIVKHAPPYAARPVSHGRTYPYGGQSLLTKTAPHVQGSQNVSPRAMQPNYRQPQQQSRPGTDMPKIIFISIFSILIIIGIFFLLRGMGVGQVIFQEDSFAEDVRDLLEENIENNRFYAVLSSVNVCVQVDSGQRSASHRILKTPLGHVILRLTQSCDWGDHADFIVKFTEWDAFRDFVREPSCTGAENTFILPSPYVLPGFTANPEADYAPFCEALQLCYGSAAIASMGISC